MASFPAPSHKVDQALSSKETSATTEKSSRVAATEVPNQGRIRRSVKHSTRFHRGNHRSRLLAPILHAGGLLLALVLIHHYVGRYVRCLRTRSRSTPGLPPKASATQTGRNSHVPRRLAFHSEPMVIVELDDSSNKEDAAVCLQEVQDSIDVDIPENANLVNEDELQSQLANLKLCKHFARVIKQFVATILTIVCIIGILYMSTGHAPNVPQRGAHNSSASGTSTSNISAQGHPTKPAAKVTTTTAGEHLSVLFPAVCAAWGLYLIFLKVEAWMRSQVKKLQVQSEAHEVEKFLAQKGPSKRRTANFLSEYTNSGFDYSNEPPPVEGPREGAGISGGPSYGEMKELQDGS